MKRPAYVDKAEWLRDEERDRAEQERLQLTEELKAAGVMRWWPHRVPGMSLHVWLDELGKTIERQERNRISYPSDHTWRAK